MTSIQETTLSTILKSDRAGRARYDKSFKQEVIQAYEESSMNAAAFSEHCGVKYPTFISWINQAKQKKLPNNDLAEKSTRRSQRHDTSKQFIIAEFATPQPEVSLKLELPSGIIIHLSSASQLDLLAEILKNPQLSLPSC